MEPTSINLENKHLVPLVQQVPISNIYLAFYLPLKIQNNINAIYLNKKTKRNAKFAEHCNRHRSYSK